MSTRSTIAIKNNDGKIKAVYSHSDGYPQYVGKILFNHYYNADLIEFLISNGDISILKEEVFSTVFYNRDRNEPWNLVRPMSFDDESSWVEFYKDSGVEFYYIFKNNKWHCYDNKVKLDIELEINK